MGDADDPDVSQLASRVPSRVEDQRDPAAPDGGCRLLVAAPQFEGDLELPADGTRCTVQWTSPRGLWILPVAFRGQERSESVRLWDLEVAGPPRREERRKFVRVPWTQAIALELNPGAEVAEEVTAALRTAAEGTAAEGTDAAGRLTVHGHTINIGEGGVLCLLREAKLPAACPVTVRLILNGTTFALPSRITWSLATGTGPRRYETAIAFNDPTRCGDTLRPLLYAEQIRLRREGLA